MASKKTWWIVAFVLVLVVVVGGVSGFVFYKTKGPGAILHDPALIAATPAEIVRPVISDAPGNSAALASTLNQLGQDTRLGNFGGEVTDAVTGEVVWQKGASTPLRPASTTKVLTAAVALFTLGTEDRIATTVVPGKEAGTVVVKAAGDVMLTSKKLDDLAAQIKQAQVNNAALQNINTVLVDTSAWGGDAMLPTWDAADIAGGFITPMEPVMLVGGRIGGATGDLPRSTTPAADVASALADRLGASETAVVKGVATDDTVIAKVESDTLGERLRLMMHDSDNVMAEAVGREIAAHAGQPATNPNAVKVTMETLQKNGINTTGVTLLDNSGLSTGDLIPAMVLDQIMAQAARDKPLRPLLDTLPVAAASGTLATRYEGTSGAGWVRGKTGTLTDTSGLTGVVVSTSGRVYSYGFISNGAEVLGSRAALDAMTTAIRG